MFSSAGARVALRAGIAITLAFLAALATAIVDGVTASEWITIATATLTVAGAWVGLGAASGNVEPFFGRKLEPPPVPPEGDQAGT